MFGMTEPFRQPILQPPSRMAAPASKKRGPGGRRRHESRSHAFFVPQCGALPRSPVHTDLRHGGGARALARMGSELWRIAEVRDAGLLRVRRLLVSGWLARR